MKLHDQYFSKFYLVKFALQLQVNWQETLS
jgi:hypothetical protein